MARLPRAVVPNHWHPRNQLISQAQPSHKYLYSSEESKSLLWNHTHRNMRLYIHLSARSFTHGHASIRTPVFKIEGLDRQLSE